MRILLVNDDGFSAYGLKALAERLYDKHELTVVAPSKEMSGMSHAAHFFTPIKVNKILTEKWECYSVEGTPVDCVMLGVLEFLKDQSIDLILCGINNIANVGTDTMFSGTVQQAIEGIYLGVPSIAISGDLRQNEDFDIVAEWFLGNISRFYKMAQITAVNINVPKLRPSFEWKEKLTSFGHQDYTDNYLYERISDTEGYYTLVGEPVNNSETDNSDCDIAWYKKGYITISPLSIRLNDEKLLKIFGELI